MSFYDLNKNKLYSSQLYNNKIHYQSLPVGKGNLQIALCVGIANSPANAMPPESDIVVAAMANCFLECGDTSFEIR